MITEDNIEVYRVGDFAKKADYMGQMGGRSTGYFGTGYYFCTTPERCAPQGGGHRPLYKMKLKNGLKLKYGTQKVHDALKLVQRFAVNYPMLIDRDRLEKLYWFARTAADLYSEKFKIGTTAKLNYETWGDGYDDWQDCYKHEYDLKRLANQAKEIPELIEIATELESDSPDWDRIDEIQESNKDYFNIDYLDELTHLRSDAIFKGLLELGVNEKEYLDIMKQIYEVYKDFYVDNGCQMWNSALLKDDSFSTTFLKILGFDGVYPAQECDDVTYGGVIYELENFEYEKLADDVSEYLNLED